MEPVPLDLLRAFKVFLDEGNVVAAAKRLHVSQPAFSQQLQRLEEYFPEPLFEKSGRSKVLTPFGAAFKRHVLPQFAALETLTAGFVKAATDPEALTLHIGGRHELFAALARRLEFAGKLHFHSMASKEAREALHRGELDLIICSHQSWDTKRYAVWPLKNDEIFLVVPAAWQTAEAAGDCFASEFLATKPFIGYSDQPPFLASWCQHHGLDPAAIAMPIICPDWRTLVALIRQGRGFSLVPEQFVQTSELRLRHEAYMVPPQVDIVVPRFLEKWLAISRPPLPS